MTFPAIFRLFYILQKSGTQHFGLMKPPFTRSSHSEKLYRYSKTLFISKKNLQTVIFPLKT